MREEHHNRPDTEWTLEDWKRAYQVTCDELAASRQAGRNSADMFAVVVKQRDEYKAAWIDAKDLLTNCRDERDQLQAYVYALEECRENLLVEYEKLAGERRLHEADWACANYPNPTLAEQLNQAYTDIARLRDDLSKSREMHRTAVACGAEQISGLRDMNVQLGRSKDEEIAAMRDALRSRDTELLEQDRELDKLRDQLTEANNTISVLRIDRDAYKQGMTGNFAAAMEFLRELEAKYDEAKGTAGVQKAGGDDPQGGGC